MIQRNIFANSFYFVKNQNQVDVLDWLNELIYNLSHNQSLDQAIESAGWKGSLALTSKLKRESKVDTVFEKLIKDISKTRRYRNYNFDKVFTEDIQRRIQYQTNTTDQPIGYRPSEVLKTVKKNKRKFRYDHETEESTIIRDIAVAHSDNVSDMAQTVGADEPGEDEVTTASVRFLQCIFLKNNGDAAHHALVINENYKLKIKMVQ